MSYNKPKSEQINLGTVTLDSVIDPTGTWIGNPTNLQGATGAQGSAGFVGSDGAQGATGAQGTTGAQGATGIQGPGGLTTLNADTLDGIEGANVVFGKNSTGSNTAATTWDAYDVCQYKSGFWEITGANWTPDTEWYWGATLAHTSNGPAYNYSGQIIIKNNATSQMWFRSILNGSNSAWAKVLSSLSTGDSVQFGSFGVGTAASGTTGEIRATNNITAYYSDMRLKNKLYNIPDPLAKVMSLNGFFFEPNEVAQSLGYELKQEVGVSAQEVEAVLPEAVAPAPIDSQYLTVRYEKLVPLLIEAIKELKREVDELKARL